jgi:hypothetical protein
VASATGHLLCKGCFHAEQGLRDAILVGTADEISAVEDECPNPAVHCSNASQNTFSTEGK